MTGSEVLKGGMYCHSELCELNSNSFSDFFGSSINLQYIQPFNRLSILPPLPTSTLNQFTAAFSSVQICVPHTSVCQCLYSHSSPSTCSQLSPNALRKLPTRATNSAPFPPHRS